MQRLSKTHVGPLTAGLSIASLALVVAAAGGFVPSTAVPAAPEWVYEAIPHVNAALSATAILTIGLGWRWIRNRDVRRHRAAMLVALALFATFLTLYCYRLIATGGAQSFPGPDAVRLYVYLPLLATHVFLALVCVPLLYYVTLLATTHSVAELPRTRHPTVGRVAATLWIVSFTLGIVVYVSLHHVY